MPTKETASNEELLRNIAENLSKELHSELKEYKGVFSLFINNKLVCSMLISSLYIKNSRALVFVYEEAYAKRIKKAMKDSGLNYEIEEIYKADAITDKYKRYKRGSAPWSFWP
ncbi:MAG: hypothetical protein ACP5K5_03835 [Candidatus Micrarchaeia archaeon]